MKTRRITLSVFISILTSVFGNHVIAQQNASTEPIKYLEPGYYIIVGAFQQEDGAEKFTGRLHRLGKDNAQYAYYPPKSIHYVHLGRYDNRRQPMDQLKDLRTQNGFETAWVFKAESYPKPPGSESKAVPEFKEDEPVEAELETEKQEEAKEKKAKEEKEEEVLEEPDNTDVTGVIDLSGGREGEDYFLYMRVRRKDNGKEVLGKVEIIDPDKLRHVKTAEAHAAEFIPKSFNRSGNVQMICEIFGYKKVQHDFNIATPFTEMTEPFLSTKDTRLVVDFELERYTQGDFATMYNVYFYKDAAIMRPESRYELNQLVEMLKENENYQIMLHGHTNGNNSGPIITLKDDSDQYFSKSAPTNEKHGSAKKLSQARADIIRRYLIDQGIDSSRMKAKGWGGKKGIYKKLDPLAYKNVRVEVEILVD